MWCQIIIVVRLTMKYIFIVHMFGIINVNNNLYKLSQTNPNLELYLFLQSYNMKSDGPNWGPIGHECPWCTVKNLGRQPRRSCSYILKQYKACY